MSKREDSDDKQAVGLRVHDEDVNPAPSQPEEESLTEGDVQASRSTTPHDPFLQPSGAFAFPIPIPSFAPNSVAPFPPINPAVWCPSPPLYSPFHPYRFPDAHTGITLRLPGLIFRPLSAMQRSLCMRPETPSTPLDQAMAADRQEKLTQRYSELCAAFERVCLGTETKSRGLQDAGSFNQFSNYPNKSATAWNEDISTAACAVSDVDDNDDDDDDYDEESPPISLQESSPENDGISKPLTQPSAAAVELSSVQGEIGNLGSLVLFPSEGYAVGVQRDYLRDFWNVKLRNHSQLHCCISPGSLSSELFGCTSLDVFGSNLVDPPASTLPSAPIVREAAPPDTGQLAEDDNDLYWRSCKICLECFWKFVFIPCGHGSCRYCYSRLTNMTCPLCMKHINQIVEVHLSPFIRCIRQ